MNRDTSHGSLVRVDGWFAYINHTDYIVCEVYFTLVETTICIQLFMYKRPRFDPEHLIGSRAPTSPDQLPMQVQIMSTCIRTTFRLDRSDDTV